jgi:hypothetical protein
MVSVIEILNWVWACVVTAWRLVWPPEYSATNELTRVGVPNGYGDFFWLNGQVGGTAQAVWTCPAIQVAWWHPLRWHYIRVGSGATKGPRARRALGVVAAPYLHHVASLRLSSRVLTPHMLHASKGYFITVVDLGVHPYDPQMANFLHWSGLLGVVGFDCEMDSVTHALVTVQLATQVVQAWGGLHRHVLVLHLTPGSVIPNAVGALLQDINTIKVGVDLHQDEAALAQLGIQLQGHVDLQATAALMGYHDRLGTVKLAGRMLDYQMLKAQAVATSFTAVTPLSQAQVLYAAADAWVAFELHMAFTQGSWPAPDQHWLPLLACTRDVKMLAASVSLIMLCGCLLVWAAW